MTANPKLVVKQNISAEDVEKINDLHEIREKFHTILQQLEESRHTELVYEIGQFLFKIEEELQRLWKFEVNTNYYRFWLVPTCNCPIMDNDDNYPYGPYYYSGHCRLHYKRRKYAEIQEN